MSNNPWPFVTVALASLGFLANTLAQQGADSASVSDDPAAFKLEFKNDFDEPDIAGSVTALRDLKERDKGVGKNDLDVTNQAKTEPTEWTAARSSSIFPPTPPETEREKTPPKFGDRSTRDDVAAAGTEAQEQSFDSFLKTIQPSAATSRLGDIQTLAQETPGLAKKPRGKLRYQETPQNERQVAHQANTSSTSRFGVGAGRFGSTSKAASVPQQRPTATLAGIDAPVHQTPKHGFYQNQNGFSSRSERERTSARNTNTEVAQLLNVAPGRRNTPSPTEAAPNNFHPRANRRFPNRNANTNQLDRDPRPVLPPTSPTRQDYQNASYGRPPFPPEDSPNKTRPVRLETPDMVPGPRSFTANQSPTGTRNVGKPNVASTTDRNSGRNDDRAVTQLFESANATAEANETTAGKLPVWPTMALFASLAANLFFGWIAWDTHSKYQDFVEESHESDLLRERQSRRLRDEPRPARDEIRPPRRSREAEEAEFLNGGLEV